MEGTSGMHSEGYERRQSPEVPAEHVVPFSPPGERQAEITNPDGGLEVPPTASPRVPTRELRQVTERRNIMPLLSTTPKPEAVLFEQAYEHARTTDAQAYIVERAPDTDTTALDIYRAADDWREAAAGNRNRVFTAVSVGRTALSNQAWDKAVKLAATRGAADFNREGKRVHALESVVAPQVQPARLEQVKTLGEQIESPVQRARVLSTVAARLAIIGETDKATTLLDEISVPTTDALETDAVQATIDRGRVAVVDRLASQDRFATSSATVEALGSITTPRMEAWALLKIAARMDAHDPKSARWEVLRDKLPASWRMLALDDRIKIIDDLAGSGHVQDAADYAMALDNPYTYDSTQTTRRAQADKIIDVAKAQVLNPDAAAAVLARFKDHTVSQLSKLGGYRPDGLTPEQRMEQTEERCGYLGQITAAELVMKALWDPPRILKALDKAYFQGENAVEYHDKACAAVAAVVARDGDTQTALEIIKRIGWYPLANGIKSKAFTDVGRAAYDYRIEHETDHYLRS